MKNCTENDESFLEFIKLVAPGTGLRTGLEYIIKAGLGALIVIGDNEELINICDGGFHINKEYLPTYLYELCKMDGAVIISGDLKKIISANVHLVPDRNIITFETGTRHQTAERTAKQTKNLIISISKRRNVITLYKDDCKYYLKDTSEIMSKANQALQTLEKYKTVFDVLITALSINEFNDIVTLEQVSLVIQRAELMIRIISELKMKIIELGNEGRFINMELEELIGNLYSELDLIIDDYKKPIEKESKEIKQLLSELDDQEIMNLNFIAKILGYQAVNSVDILHPIGYRILDKLPKLPTNIINNLIQRYGNLKCILSASIDDLDLVDGIGEVRAKSIKQGLKKTYDSLTIGAFNYRLTDFM